MEDEIEVIPQTIFNPKMMHAMKNLQASYNEDTNKIMEQAAKKKLQKNFFIHLATITMLTENTMPMEDGP